MDILHHDLSNPLNAVRSASILMSDQPALAPDLIPLILRNTAKAQEMIDNARRYVHLENTDRLDLTALDLGDLLRSAAAEQAAAAAEAGVSVELDIEGPLPVIADPQVETVFANLLSNAVKYAAGGRRVIVSARRDGDRCRVAVADAGPGVGEAGKGTIFNRFSRRDKAGVKGSGLGLAIARRLVELHGGSISAGDNPGGGAVFTVLLPCGSGSGEALRGP
jgi:signal transduction histidine kinase